jgi:hypothetical protein
MLPSPHYAIAAQLRLAARACAGARRCLDRVTEGGRLDQAFQASSRACIAQSRDRLERLSLVAEASGL